MGGSPFPLAVPIGFSSWGPETLESRSLTSCLTERTRVAPQSLLWKFDPTSMHVFFGQSEGDIVVTSLRHLRSLPKGPYTRCHICLWCYVVSLVVLSLWQDSCNCNLDFAWVPATTRGSGVSETNHCLHQFIAKIAMYCSHCTLQPAGDAWNLRWGETSRFAVGSTRRFRSLARPIDPEKHRHEIRRHERGGGFDRCFEPVFVWWLNQWSVICFYMVFSHMNPMNIFWKLLWSWSGTLLHAYVVSLLWFCLMIRHVNIIVCNACKLQVGLIIDAISCRCPCQLCFSSGSVSSPPIGTLTPTSRWWVGLLPLKILETDSINCVELHHFVIKQNM